MEVAEATGLAEAMGFMEAMGFTVGFTEAMDLTAMCFTGVGSTGDPGGGALEHGHITGAPGVTPAMVTPAMVTPRIIRVTSVW